ncbi:uncharacterized protein EAF01_002661 [Botrytis porri]|uniref:Uncharacterized protein n=1 Tax=Botrytis porri TaxID=87229 RepID=A0A4Z1L3Q7_9HELO|nr:uncharacterized protein EAF01_002661 [Botrytis porri]KAF7911153.1 hypothetical protein EAF01_002661 [Botrytis porri]TGO91418.1 hypothetical protein BPOR_0028g00100 [Botrytis porri]
MKMVQKRTIEVVIPQMTSQSITSNTKSNKVVSKTIPTIPLATIDEEIDLCSPSLPRRTDRELQSKLDDGKMSSLSSLLGHFFSGAREEEEKKEKEDAEVICSANSPPLTNTQLLNRHGGNPQTSAISRNREAEEIKREIDNTNETTLPWRSDIQVRFELESHETSIRSSASRETTPQMTPTSSVVNEMEGDLVDLHEDEDEEEEDVDEEDEEEVPLHHTDEEFHSDEFEPHFALKSFTIEQHPSPKPFIIQQPNPPTQTKPPAPPQQTHPTHPTLHPLPPHEIFLHTLPPNHASVPQIRLWIHSWFSGRDIPIHIPREPQNPNPNINTNINLNLQQSINCISWSGEDIHTSSPGTLEQDLRGWMLGAYARPIVRDIERARNVERERRWQVAVGRVADFLYGAVVMGVVGLVLMVWVPCPCRRY